MTPMYCSVHPRPNRLFFNLYFYNTFSQILKMEKEKNMFCYFCFRVIQKPKISMALL